MEELYATALRMRGLGNPAAARQICRALLAARPHHREALDLLAELCCEAGDMDEAAELCQRALALMPEDPAALAVLGEVYLGCGRVDDAITVLRRSVEAGAEVARRHARLATALRRAEQHDAAVASYARAVACDDAAPWMSIEFALFLVALGRDEAVFGVLDAAAAAFPGEPRLWWMLADRLRSSGRPYAAASAYHRAVACGPELFGVHYDYATLLAELGRTATAMWAARRAQALDPEHPMIGPLLRRLAPRREAASA